MNLKRNTIKRNEHLIDPEEILLDKRAEEMGETQLMKMDWPLSSGFLRGFFIVCLVLVFILGARIFDLEIVKGAYYSDLALHNKTRYYVINPPRGIIYDRYHNPLVLNSPSFSLIMVPLDLPRRDSDRELLINQVVSVFNLNKDEIENILKDDNILSSINPILLKTNLNVDEIRKFEANALSNKGFVVEADTSRYYPYADTMAQLVGYVGKMSSQDKLTYPNYPLTSIVGKEGLELEYENSLQGTWGKRLVEVDAYGKVKQDLGTLDPQPGKDLNTTIDKDLQIKLYDSLKNQLANLGVTRGAAIALNPKTGEVLALVSLPSFDPNVLTKGYPSQTINQYFQDKNHPLFNRVVSGLYAPGSLIKPLMAVAALEEKIIDPLKKIYDEGKIVINNPYHPEVKYVFNDWKPHGWVDMRKALAVSCNVYFWTVGGGYQNITGLGLAKIQKYWNLFGLNKKQGIDLSDEATGVLPSEAWLKTIRPEDPVWKLGDTYNISIGEGGLILTPLELVDYISAISNNGVMMKPHLNKDTNPTPLLNLNVPLSDLKIIQEGMRQVVTIGTATSLNDLPMPVAGKSGSPKFISLGKAQFNALFAAYAPYNNPQIVLLVLIEDPPQGSIATLPVVHDVLSWYYENRITTSTTTINNKN
ncbi:MAG: penicillin-binding protein 2 [Minisyncoccia bacterium]